MFSNVYIIGRIPDNLSINAQKRFYEAQKKLEKFNVKVFNPVNSYLGTSVSKEEAIKYNMRSLLNANAVYVLNDSYCNENNIELMMAMKLNILIMHEF